MLSSVKKSIIEYMKGQISPTGYMVDFKDAIGGPINSLDVPTIKLPCAVLSVTNFKPLISQGNPPIIIESRFRLEVYSATLKKLSEAEDDCLNLLWSPDGSRGILRMFANKQGFVANGQTFLVTPNDNLIEFVPGGAPGDGFTFGAIVPLDVITFKG